MSGAPVEYCLSRHVREAWQVESENMSDMRLEMCLKANSEFGRTAHSRRDRRMFSNGGSFIAER